MCIYREIYKIFKLMYRVGRFLCVYILYINSNFRLPLY